jgi:multiple sugar transport system substrate-binding protein
VRRNQSLIFGTLLVILALVVAGCAAPVTAPTTSESAAGTGAAPAAETAAQVVPITILINDSPWYPGFEALVEKYKEDTGNEVTLNVTPFNGMLEKSRNAVQASQSEFDILTLNEQWYMQFYAGGLVTPIKEIDPEFELDPNVIEYGYATRWDPEIGYSGPNGELYGLPINGNIQLYFYRTDLFEEAGLEVPQTWDEVAAAAEALQDPPNLYGFAIRSVPGNWEYQAYLASYGTNIIDLDLETGQWSVGLNSDAAIEATNMWKTLGTTYGPANFANLGQAENLALMAGGQLAQVHMVGAAAPNFNNPEVSTVVGKVGAGVVPGTSAENRATMSGIWVMGIPHNLPDENKQAAMAFLEWALTKDAQTYYAQAGAIPVRQDTYEELSDDPDNGWWMKAMADSTPYIVPQPRLTETPQIVEVVDRYLGFILIDQMTVEDALNAAAQEIYDIMVEAGYDVAPLN